jgi:pimeloyl-ACP methyl ester carboxylesterase
MESNKRNKSTSIILQVSRWIFFSLLSLLILAALFLLLISSGKTSPVTDDNGNRFPNSISVIEKPMIGGVPQGLIIRGADKNNPVLLFIHGGPGITAYPFLTEEFKKLERLFTICYWEQRGAGMSYSGKVAAATMTLDQLTSDAAEVSRYLIQQFNQPKIYLLGHSWGTFLGSFTVKRYPELFHAYLGVGQLGDTYMAEKYSYDFTLQEAIKRKDDAAIKELQQLKMPEKTASGDVWWDYLAIQRSYVLKYGGARYGHERTAIDIRKAVLFCNEYTLRQKLNYAKAITLSQAQLWHYLMENDLNLVLTKQQIPVYIFQGIHDHQTDYGLAKSYFDKLEAPVKRFYTLTHSAHSPHVEEYDAFEKIIRTEVLAR